MGHGNIGPVPHSVGCGIFPVNTEFKSLWFFGSFYEMFKKNDLGLFLCSTCIDELFDLSGFFLFFYKCLQGFLLFLLFLAASSHGAAAEAGKVLVDKNCYSCHGDEVYTRSDRKVKTFGGLRNQVQRCELALGLRWFDNQIDSATAYLNDSFYHFK